MIKFYEAKQVGKIYHFSDLPGTVKYTVSNDTLSSSGYFYNRMVKSNKAVSFTRNPRLRLNTLRSFPVIVRYTVDGNKLSENYSIKPYSAYGVSSPRSYDIDDTDLDEMEEIVIGPIRNFSKYILGIQVVVKDKDISLEDLLDDTDYKNLLKYAEAHKITDNFTIVVKGKERSLSSIYDNEEVDYNEFYNLLKHNNAKILNHKSVKFLEPIFYDIVHKIDDDYIYDLILYISNLVDKLSEKDRENIYKALINVYFRINPYYDEDDYESFKEGLVDSLNI